MSSLDVLDCVLKEKLSEDRYFHSVRVMQKAEEYARIYYYNVYIAKLVGLGHDFAKDMSYEDSINYVIENNLDSLLLDYNNKYLVHGYVGADILEKQYNFTNEMGDAVRYHTTGRANMTLLEKIIFLADKTEDGRNFASIEQERDFAMFDLDFAMNFALSNTIHHTEEKGKPVDPITLQASKYFSTICENRQKVFQKCS